MAAGDPDATTFLEKVEQRVFVHTSTSNIKVGSIVLLKKDNVPPLRWQLGCIQEVIPGGDGVIRVAMVRTATGLIKRAVVNKFSFGLCYLIHRNVFLYFFPNMLD